MKLKWTDEKIKYFNKKIPMARQDNSWIIWVIIITVSLTGLAYLFFGR